MITFWRDDHLSSDWFVLTRHGAYIQIGFCRRYGVSWWF